MRCSKCGSEKIKISREKVGYETVSGTVTTRRHGILYWIFIGSWMWAVWLFLDICTLGWTYRMRKRKNTIVTNDSRVSHYRTVAICQECGNTWTTDSN